jgi:hypothetical protein
VPHRAAEASVHLLVSCREVTIYLTFWLCIKLIILLVALSAKFERRTREEPAMYGVLVLVLAGVSCAAYVAQRRIGPA